MRLQHDLDALALHCRLEQFRGAGIELTFHKARHDVDKRDRKPALGEPARGLHPEQSATNHDGTRTRKRPLQDAHIVDIAEGENAREEVSGHRQPDGL